MSAQTKQTPDEILLAAMGGRVERPGEPRIVAETTYPLDFTVSPSAVCVRCGHNYADVEERK